MMRRATRYHVVRGTLVAALLFLIGWGGYEWNGTLKAHALLDGLLRADTTKAPAIVEDMAPYRRWLDPLLHDAQAQAEKDNDRRKQLHARLAFLPVDATQVEYLYGRLLDAEPGAVPVIRDALAPHKDALLDRLWAVVEAPEKGKESQRLRAAAALAKYDSEDERWGQAGALVVNDLVLENPVFLGQWSEAFLPVKNRLLPRLSDIFRDHRPESTAERNLATNLLADYAADQPQVLTDLLMDADEKQFAVIYPKFKEQGEQGLPVLTGEIDKNLPSDVPSSDLDSGENSTKSGGIQLLLGRLVAHGGRGAPKMRWKAPLHERRPSLSLPCLTRVGAKSVAAPARWPHRPRPPARPPATTPGRAPRDAAESGRHNTGPAPNARARSAARRRPRPDARRPHTDPPPRTSTRKSASPNWVFT